MNDKAPNPKINNDSFVRNTSACVEAPTVRPNNIVTISMRALLAVLARRFVTPLSLRRLPKNNIPSNGNAEGLMNVVKRRPTIGKHTFSVLLTIRGAFMWMRRSFGVVSNFIIGGWIRGTSAM